MQMNAQKIAKYVLVGVAAYAVGSLVFKIGRNAGVTSTAQLLGDGSVSDRSVKQVGKYVVGQQVAAINRSARGASILAATNNVADLPSSR